MTIYKRSQRKTKTHYYFKWLTYSNKPDDKVCEHFGFMIARENQLVHERLFNYYKNKEVLLNKLENMYSTYEAEKCPFIPTINHSISINEKYFPISNKTSCKFRSISEEKDYNNHNHSHKNTNINSNNNNKQSLSTTHANSNLLYTSLLSNKSNTIDYNLSSKRKSSITPRSIKKQFNKLCNKNKSYSNNFETNNAEMKYVMNYLTNQSGSGCSSLLPSYRTNQGQYLLNNKNNQSTSSYVNLLSNRDRKSAKETNRNKGQLFRGTNKGGDLNKLSQYLHESNQYQYLNNNKENQYENLSSTNIYDKITSYFSQENQTNQMSSTENNFNSKSKAKVKTKPIDNGNDTNNKSKTFFYTFHTNSKGNYNQYKQLKKKNPLIIQKQCKNSQIMLSKSTKDCINENNNDIDKDINECDSNSNRHFNSNQRNSNAIEKKLNGNGDNNLDRNSIKNNKSLQ